MDSGSDSGERTLPQGRPVDPRTLRQSRDVNSGRTLPARRQSPQSPRTRPTSGRTRPLDAPLASALSRYRIREELGRGGMGVVQLADDPGLRRSIAIKRLLDTHSDSARAGFIEEAQITGQLEHPNIVPVYELGIDDQQRPYMAMKRVEGATLQELVRESAAATHVWADDAAHWLAVFDRVCDAIGFAHSRGVIHRDLKPDNVMVGRFGEVLVMDWGLAKPVGHDDGDAPTSDRRADDNFHTVDGSVAGTPAFMAPEQARGDVATIGPATDVFALGALLYSLLTLQPPYAGRGVRETLVLAAKRTLTAPRVRAPRRGIPAELNAITMKAMAEQPADRYASVEDLQADIRAYQANLVISARRDSVAGRLVKWVKRHPTATIAGTLFLVFASAAALMAMQLRASTQQAELAAEREARARDHQGRAEAEAQLARTREAVARGELAEVSRLLDVTATIERDAAIREFYTRWAANEQAGMNTADSLATFTDIELVRYITAFERYFATLETFERQPDAQDWFLRGLIRMHAQSRPDDALDDFRRALELVPDFSDAYLSIGNAWSMKGDHQQALTAWAKAIETNPQSYAARHRRGLYYIQTQNWPAALTDFTRCAELRPDLADVHANVGFLYWKTGRYEDAVAACTRGIAADPDNRKSWGNRAQNHYELGNIDQALADARRTSELEPDYVNAWWLQAKIHLQRKEWGSAIVAYERMMALGNLSISMLVELGECYCRSNQSERAVAVLTRALATEPDNRDALYWRAIGHGQVRRGEQALVDLARLIRLEPSNWRGHVLRGEILAHLGRRDESEQAFEQALALAEPAAQAQIHRIRERARAATDDE